MNYCYMLMNWIFNVVCTFFPFIVINHLYLLWKALAIHSCTELWAAFNNNNNNYNWIFLVFHSMLSDITFLFGCMLCRGQKVVFAIQTVFLHNFQMMIDVTLSITSSIQSFKKYFFTWSISLTNPVSSGWGDNDWNVWTICLWTH